ncbi:flavodoxin [uncultured Anaerovibrio sp.]|uniref:flavodoxin n=1 Tax=uncultured Anaerovibrio sp. TaxID=361586 RepID=UPI002639CB97|nr:flavodoxin [uncultured Anaerovibrio sp.]
MKKMLLLCVSLLVVLGIMGCGADKGKAEEKPAGTPQATNSAPAPAAKSKILVAYFSATNNTKQLAETTAKALGADLYEIRPAKPYTREDLNYNDETTRATVEQKDDKARPELADHNGPIAEHDTIILVHPIWWGQEPRIMDTFVESYDFTGKNMTNICTSGGSDIGTSGDYLQKLTKGKANWKPGKLFSKDASEAEIKNWFKALGF